jgi:hypothetical protein
LLQSQSQLAQTLEGLPIGVVVYGVDRRPTYINPRAVDILANPAKGILPSLSGRRTIKEAMKYFSFHITGGDQEYPVEHMPVWRAFNGTSAAADDIEADLVDRRVPLEIWANPVKDENGRVESVVAAFQDITRRKKMQAELDQYHLQLEKLVEQRTEELSQTNEILHTEIAERGRLEEMLRWRMEWLVVVNQVYQAVSNPSDLSRAYDAFAETIKNLFGAQDALLAELDPGSKDLRLLSHTCRNAQHPDLSGSVFSIASTSLTNDRFKQGLPIMLRCELLNGLDGPAGVHYGETNNQLLALVPLHCQENTFGMLGLEFLQEERLFSVEEMALIEKICLDITQVRDKARLAEQNRALIAV